MGQKVLWGGVVGMMGYMALIAPCLACGQTFSSNPNFVPSLNNNPVCRPCMDRVNERRRTMGLPPHPIHPEAYQPEEVP